MKAIGIKKSNFRSEIRTFKGKKGNYLIIKFKDDKNKTDEFHVYAEVIAKEAARDIANVLGIKLPPNKKKNEANVRTIWDFVWKEL